MSDQVEIVAAEDAKNNAEGEEAIVSAQATSEQPESTPSEVEPQAQTVPAAEDAPETEDAPVAEATPDAEESEEKNAPADAASAVTSAVTSAVSSVADSVADAATSAVSAIASAVTGNDEDSETEGDAEADVKAEASDDTEAAAPEGESAEAGSSDNESTETDSKGNVRILSVGQQVTGNIKRIADFGAFVDIGVGRDGLIHISELSVRRVGKVTDVLSEGQEVTAWIKKLDRDRNRISLTLIDPNTKTIRDLNKDDVVKGTVTRILPYGAFVDIGIGRDALLHVREMGVGYVAKPEDVVKVGDEIESRIIELSRRRGRVDLSLKGLRDEPEPTQSQSQSYSSQDPASRAQLFEKGQAYSQAQSQSRNPRQQPEPQPEVEDDFEDMEVLSPMELAFKRAMEAEGMELNVGKKKQGKRNRRDRNSLQDEIISRTLTSGRK